jgi:hypothetical protein
LGTGRGAKRAFAVVASVGNERRDSLVSLVEHVALAEETPTHALST